VRWCGGAVPINVVSDPCSSIDTDLAIPALGIYFRATAICSRYEDLTMPILEDPRHEAFARELTKGKSATEAYEIAGFKPDRKTRIG